MMSLVFIGLCFVPILLHYVFRWDIPNYIAISYFLFIILSTLLGTIYDFYEIIPIYDIILHTASGVLLAGFGLYIYTRCTHGAKNNPIIIVLFMLGFAVLGGVLWEMWEYWSDEILSLNSQRHTLIDGVALMGHEAITDTIFDLMSDLLGAVMFSVGYVVYLLNYRKKNKEKK